MTQKVLVLCQRRSGIGEELNSLNDRIEQLVHARLGEDTDIKYVSSKGSYRGEVDMEFDFDDNEETSSLEKDYSLIICNTCPYPYMKYKIIHAHLRERGYLAITVYNKHANMPAEEIEQTAAYHQTEPLILAAGFRKVGHMLDAIVFQKRSKGGTRKRKSRRNYRMHF